MTYHDTVHDLYREAAQRPADNLCCVAQSPRYLPGLHIPSIMHDMNYGCGSTVHLQDMRPGTKALYVGVGGGLELLQLAYFTRQPSSVIGVDPVAEMRNAAQDNLIAAADENDWFDISFIDIRDGDALKLPLKENSIDLAAQNCLFNIFDKEDLSQALREMHRVLKPGGRLVMSDPITPRPIPNHLAADDRLRALCLSGCLSLNDYIDMIVSAGFGSIEVRSRRPYRLLDAIEYQLDEDLLLETIEIAAYRTPVPADGPCVFTGKMAIYSGPGDSFDDGKGHVLPKNIPAAVCDKTANALATLNHITVTPSTWHYQGGGCC